MNGWVKSKRGAQYAGVSERTFRNWLKAGLSYSRLPSGTILIKESWIDDYLERFQVQMNEVNDIVKEVCKGMEL